MSSQGRDVVELEGTVGTDRQDVKGGEKMIHQVTPPCCIMIAQFSPLALTLCFARFAQNLPLSCHFSELSIASLFMTD